MRPQRARALLAVDCVFCHHEGSIPGFDLKWVSITVVFQCSRYHSMLSLYSSAVHLKKLFPVESLPYSLVVRFPFTTFFSPGFILATSSHGPFTTIESPGINISLKNVSTRVRTGGAESLRMLSVLHPNNLRACGSVYRGEHACNERIAQMNRKHAMAIRMFFVNRIIWFLLVNGLNHLSVLFIHPRRNLSCDGLLLQIPT